MSKNDKDNLFGYPVRLYQLSEEDGGGWAAEAIDLKGCFSDGESPEEALQNLRDVILGWMEVAEEDGKEIPRPSLTKAVDDIYSGKFTIRIPKSLHRALAEKAENEGASLNQYVGTLLAYGLGASDKEAFTPKENAAAEEDELYFVLTQTQTFKTKNYKKHQYDMPWVSDPSFITNLNIPSLARGAHNGRKN